MLVALLFHCSPENKLRREEGFVQRTQAFVFGDVAYRLAWQGKRLIFRPSHGDAAGIKGALEVTWTRLLLGYS